MTRCLLFALTLLALAACATPTGTAQPTPSSETSTTLSIPTSTTIGGVVPTGRGPSAFTTTSAPGPIQVLVESVACVRYAGDGWRVRWRLENNSASPAAGPLAAQVDDSPPQLLAVNLRLDGHRDLTGTHTVTGAGESISLVWAVTESGRFNVARTVASFPVEVADCPVDPADEQAAGQATTTTGKP